MRSYPLLPLLLLVALGLPLAGSGQEVSPPSRPLGGVKGVVFGKQRSTSYPLPHALLEFARTGEHRGVATDSQGRYQIEGMAPGPWRVHVVHVGHEGMSMEILVPAEGALELDMELNSKPIRLAPLTIRASPSPLKAGQDAPPIQEVGEISLRAMEGTTGMVETGLAQVVRALPGSNQAEPTDVLLMRGSAADLKLVLLDGAPVYTPFHLGGLVESFDPLALGGASLFLGGAPAQFDGGLSYILDLRTRKPRKDRFRARAAVDLLTGRAMLEGPALGGGVLVGTRVIHDLGTPLLNRASSPYGYGDLLIRGSWGGEGGAGGFLTGFWNQERVHLDLGSLTEAEGAAWGNQAISGGFHQTLGRTFAEIRGSVSRYDARLPVSDSIPLFARSSSQRFRVTADLFHPWSEGTLRWGAVLDQLDSDYSAQGLDDQGIPVGSGLALNGTTLGVYGEGSRELGKAVQFRGGVRLDHFSGSEGLRVAPRAALSWFLTDDAVLTLAAGRYHQLTSMSANQIQESLSNGAVSPTYTPPTGISRLAVGKADHLVVSLDQILLPGLRMSIDGYMKTFSGVFQVSGPALNASGMDLRVAREGENTSGWLGYTLSWFWASEEGFLGGNSRFSGRHLLSAGINTRISQGTGLRVRVGYGDGLPYTSIPVYSTPGIPTFDGSSGHPNRFEMDGDNLLNQAPSLAVGPDEGFLRVEGEIFAEWNTRLGGRAFQLRPYLRVLNALNRRDALFYHFDPWRSSSPRPLAEMSALPLLGVEVIF